MAGRATHVGVRFGGTAGEDLVDYAVVRLNSAGVYVYCDAGETPDGFLQEGALNGKPVTVYEFGGEAPAIGGTTWAVGDLLKPANDGKLQVETDPNVKTLDTRARAVEACTVAGQKPLVHWLR